jgi:hypothetical protein
LPKQTNANRYAEKHELNWKKGWAEFSGVGQKHLPGINAVRRQEHSDQYIEAAKVRGQNRLQEHD